MSEPAPAAREPSSLRPATRRTGGAAARSAPAPGKSRSSPSTSVRWTSEPSPAASGVAGRGVSAGASITPASSRSASCAASPTETAPALTRARHISPPSSGLSSIQNPSSPTCDVRATAARWRPSVSSRQCSRPRLSRRVELNTLANISPACGPWSETSAVAIRRSLTSTSQPSAAALTSERNSSAARGPVTTSQRPASRWQSVGMSKIVPSSRQATARCTAPTGTRIGSVASTRPSTSSARSPLT